MMGLCISDVFEVRLAFLDEGCDSFLCAFLVEQAVENRRLML